MTDYVFTIYTITRIYHYGNYVSDEFTSWDVSVGVVVEPINGERRPLTTEEWKADQANIIEKLARFRKAHNVPKPIMSDEEKQELEWFFQRNE